MTERSLWRKDVVGWSLYDFANTIYSMNIVTLYLKRYLIDDLGYKDHWFDIPYSISMAIAALLLPALGAMSDYGTKKRLFLFLFTLSCCISVGAMAAVPPAAIWILLSLLIIANFTYEAGQPFYNALLYSVADGRQARMVSGVGVALGYVGSILGMLVVSPFVTGTVFGLAVPFLSAGGKSDAFLPSAVLFMVFALPLFLWVRENPGPATSKVSLRKAYRDVWQCLRDSQRYPGVRRFLIADYFFEDAVATVIINIGLYCSVVVGLAEEQIIGFLTVSTVTAVIGSFLIGKLAQRWSLRTLLLFIVWGWILCLVCFVITDNMTVIWILGSAVGVLLGGLWTVTRPLLAELVPREELGRFFGLFALSGRAAAVIGPLVWTSVVLLFRSDSVLGKAVAELFDLSATSVAGLPYKAAVVSLALMMIVGLVIYRKVPKPRGDQLG